MEWEEREGVGRTVGGLEAEAGKMSREWRQAWGSQASVEAASELQAASLNKDP